ncbi:MAG TPA: TniQ family protein [Pyrinomonadaceae bacterium]|nr:TniQ family protein [Pyrinomonadaceae bacterium]
MISCFPDPHSDELLFSVYVRFDATMPYLHRGIAIREMFGVEYAAAAIDLPNRIDHLIGSIVIKHNYTADGLVDDNTLYPFYAPFIPPERALAVRREMRESGTNHVYERLGITAGRLKPPTYLKFCPECVSDDRRLCGETYWHRIHQVPGVEVCQHHSVFLEASAASWRTSKSREEVMTAERAVHAMSPRPLDPSNNTHTALLKLAEGAAWLLKWRGQALDSEVLLNRYYNLLLRRGLAFFNGRVRSSELTEKFITFYTPELLERLQCPIGDQS